MNRRFPPLKIFRSPWTLAAAALLVGVAIIWDGAGARTFNGIGGVVWLACAVALGTDLRRDRHWPKTSVVAVGLALFLAVVVRPSDGIIAVVAFSLGGALIAIVARASAVTWSIFLPALWLPVHLTVAVVNTLYRAMTDGEAVVRPDPPPTAAVVPLLMVLAAWTGGWLVTRARTQRDLARRGAGPFEHRTMA